jgi:hypothetical protein
MTKEANPTVVPVPVRTETPKPERTKRQRADYWWHLMIIEAEVMGKPVKR